MDWATASPELLFQACGKPDSKAAWEEFMRRYHTVLTAAAARVSNHWGKGTPDQIDDIVQEIYLRLCADDASTLTTFRESRPDAAFGYIKVVATNLARDYFRKESAKKRSTSLTHSFEEVGDVIASANEPERALMLQEVDRLLVRHTQTETGARDRAIFGLYYRHGMTAKAIAELPSIGLTAKGVEGVLHRLTGLIRRAIGQAQGSGAD